MRPTLRPLVACLLVMIVSAGCWAARVDGPTRDDLSTWSAEPLAPNASLARVAASGESSCNAGPEGGPVNVLLQDRRTEWTAAFLFAGASAFGSCFVTAAQGGSVGGGGPLPGPMTSELSVDDNGVGDVADGKARQLGGRTSAGVARVVVELTDDRAVTATVGRGYWLAWWPDVARAATVTAFDGSGAVIEIVEVPE